MSTRHVFLVTHGWYDDFIAIFENEPSEEEILEDFRPHFPHLEDEDIDRFSLYSFNIQRVEVIQND